MILKNTWKIFPEKKTMKNIYIYITVGESKLTLIIKSYNIKNIIYDNNIKML